MAGVYNFLHCRTLSLKHCKCSRSDPLHWIAQRLSTITLMEWGDSEGGLGYLFCALSACFFAEFLVGDMCCFIYNNHL
jgi:hypothetical protein